MSVLSIDEKRAWILELTKRPDLQRTFVDADIRGFNPGLADTIEGIWHASTVFAYPATIGEQIEVISSSVNDTAAGTGMRTARLHFLTPIGVENTLDLTLNGVGAVAHAFTNIAWPVLAYGLTFGALARADGSVTFRTVAAAIEFERIGLGARGSASARRRVPAGWSLMVFGWEVNCMPSTGAIVELAHDYDGMEDGVAQFLASTRGVKSMQVGNAAPLPRVFDPPLWLPAGTTIEAWASRTSAVATSATVNLEAVLLPVVQPTS